jgi:G3E family GTPase
MQPIAKIPTTLITGFLGVGKTTAILELLAHRPPGERWAVLVNEFGTIGIDGAVLSGSDAVAIREVAGGCICCTANTPLRVALTQLIRKARPQRLLIEPTGLGHPAGIIDALRDPYLAPIIDLQAVICLVDARLLGQSDPTPLFLDQIQLADILVANKTDLADPQALARFREFSATLYPPKRLVTETRYGRLDPAWLDLPPLPAQLRTHLPIHAATLSAVPPPAGHVTYGLQFPPETVFSRQQLSALFDAWRAWPALARAKGVFHTGREWSASPRSPGGATAAWNGSYKKMRSPTGLR